MANTTTRFVLILVLGFFISCGDNTTGIKPSKKEESAVTIGTLEVSITTEGESKDEDGYELITQGQETKTTASDDIITFPDIEEGTYQLELKEVEANCSVEGDNPLEVEIVPDETTSVTITINCKFALRNKIVFGSDRDGSFDIYYMDPDGSNIKQLTDHDAYDANPVVSTDGTRIAFESSRNSDASNLFIMNADGSNIQQLTASLGYTYGFSWSPDDKYIAFNDSRTGNGEIYIIQADGNSEVRLTDGSATSVYYSSPSWTPEGDKIVCAGNTGSVSEIYIMNADGTHPQPLTDYSAYSNSPAVSPDGSKIAFRSNLNGDFKIYTMNIDGTERTKRTEGASSDQYVSWSPDGSEIVFQSVRNGNDELYRIPIDGSSGPINITNDPAFDERPYWSR